MGGGFHAGGETGLEMGDMVVEGREARSPAQRKASRVERAAAAATRRESPESERVRVRAEVLRYMGGRASRQNRVGWVIEARHVRVRGVWSR